MLGIFVCFGVSFSATAQEQSSTWSTPMLHQTPETRSFWHKVNSDNLLTASGRGRQHFWLEMRALTKPSQEQRTDSTKLICPRSLCAWPMKQREGAAAVIAGQLLLQLCQTAGHSPKAILSCAILSRGPGRDKPSATSKENEGRQKAI